MLFQRLKTQVLNWRKIKGHPAEISKIFVNEILPAKIKNHRRMFWQGRIFWRDEHASRHTEMAQQYNGFASFFGVKLKQKIFPATRQAGEFCTGQSLSEFL